MSNTGLDRITENYALYLRDESRKTGKADTISFPVTMEEVSESIRDLHGQKIKVTVQGARTGISGGAVPDGGHILNLSRMNRVLGMRFDAAANRFILKVQPGLELAKLRLMLSKKDFDTHGWDEVSREVLEAFRQSGKWFFPPDPTEASASIGGMTACNASGARSFLYGPTRNYIESLSVILPDGALLSLKRKRERADKDHFSVTTESGRIIEGRIPGYRMPEVKNASGYYSAEDMEVIDLFTGSEGTLGIICEIEIGLLPLPGYIWGVTAFFEKEGDALRFVQTLRTDSELGQGSISRLAAIELFNADALSLLKNMKMGNPAFKNLLNLPDTLCTAIYTEYHGSTREEIYRMVGKAAEILRNCGGNPEWTWTATNDRETERLHFFRHAVPEAVNLTIDERRKTVPGLTKLGTDMAVPDPKLMEVMAMYNSGLKESGLDSVIFGHIGNNHAHVNILPKSMEEYEAGKSMYQAWARKVISLGGTVSAEHGIGKLKTAMLRDMYGDRGIAEMLRVKGLFDPDLLLNAGNLFSKG